MGGIPLLGEMPAETLFNAFLGAHAQITGDNLYIFIRIARVPELAQPKLQAWNPFRIPNQREAVE
jgi:hypothetical protein